MTQWLSQRNHSTWCGPGTSTSCATSPLESPRPQTLPTPTGPIHAHRPHPRPQTLPTPTDPIHAHRPYPRPQTLPTPTDPTHARKPYPRPQTLSTPTGPTQFLARSYPSVTHTLSWSKPSRPLSQPPNPGTNARTFSSVAPTAGLPCFHALAAPPSCCRGLPVGVTPPLLDEPRGATPRHDAKASFWEALSALDWQSVSFLPSCGIRQISFSSRLPSSHVRASSVAPAAASPLATSGFPFGPSQPSLYTFYQPLASFPPGRPWHPPAGLIKPSTGHPPRRPPPLTICDPPSFPENVITLDFALVDSKDNHVPNSPL
ncbi:vegetative cell wall protein gp1-like [Penaeus chinensis]|uniref:vegetative cell wall protein gp1-like n=1 Tax=Penaeus chinensis TaxID=139456 RepID=UPI001FB75C95|nr:vegetative cell wall protein gp1-like [Penaeus chinensis]